MIITKKIKLEPASSCQTGATDGVSIPYEGLYESATLLTIHIMGLMRRSYILKHQLPIPMRDNLRCTETFTQKFLQGNTTLVSYFQHD